MCYTISLYDKYYVDTKYVKSRLVFEQGKPPKDKIMSRDGIFGSISNKTTMASTTYFHLYSYPT